MKMCGKMDLMLVWGKFLTLKGLVKQIWEDFRGIIFGDY
jgi:hypothetical protein